MEVPLASRLLTLRTGVRPDAVSEHYHALGVNLTIRTLPPHGDGGSPTVLIEGNSQALVFLADLLIAQAADQLDCGFQILAPAPGLLDSRSECGLYVHVLPCEEPEATLPYRATRPGRARSGRPGARNKIRIRRDTRGFARPPGPLVCVTASDRVRVAGPDGPPAPYL